jgi:hypothetical protein
MFPFECNRMARDKYIQVFFCSANNLTWTIREDGLGTAFSNGIKSVDNRFVVPRHDYGDSALYFIYAAVTFDFADETYLKVEQFPVTLLTLQCYFIVFFQSCSYS